jgi:hypothetical protein
LSEDATLICFLSFIFSVFVVEIKGDIPVHSVDIEPSANLVIPNQDSVVSISSEANFSHPHYDESATSSMFSFCFFLNIFSFGKLYYMIRFSHVFDF